MTMTHRECLRKVLGGQRTAWVPNYELGLWQQTVDRWRAEGLPRDRTYIGRLDMFEGEPLLGLDRRDFARLDASMDPPFETEVLDETDRYITIRHANGIVTKALKEGTVRGQRMSMDTYIDFPVKDEATWADVKRRYDPKAVWRYPFWWDEKVRLWQGRDYPVVLMGNAAFGLYSQLRSWVGTVNLSYMFYDNPKLVAEMLEFATGFFLELVARAVREVQFDYFSFFEDCAGKNAPLFGPDLFDRFFMKHYRLIIDRLNRAGIRSIWLDSDGTIDALIPKWLAAGVNCLWPLEQAAGMDPRRLRREYGRDLILAGGIDKREIAKGPQAIEREMHAKVPPLLESGGYIPHIDHAVAPDISYDNFMYYMDLKRKLIGRG